MKTQQDNEVSEEHQEGATAVAVGSTDWFGEWGDGIRHDKAVINLHVVYDSTACGEFDDSACFILERELMKYNGVKAVRAETVLSRLDGHPGPLEVGDSPNTGRYAMSEQSKTSNNATKSHERPSGSHWHHRLVICRISDAFLDLRWPIYFLSLALIVGFPRTSIWNWVGGVALGFTTCLAIVRSKADNW